jgi:AcrR family transcriptional regulator
VEHGYTDTSVARVAAEAGVSERTVFAGFASKVNLLQAALEAAVAGDAEEVPLHARPAMQRVHQAATATEAFERLAHAAAEIGERSYAMVAVVHRAADADPQIARLEQRLEAQRLTGAGYLADTVADRLRVTDPTLVAEMRDTIWVLASPLQYGLLVHERGWSVPRYRDWLARALSALVPPVGRAAR